MGIVNLVAKIVVAGVREARADLIGLKRDVDAAAKVFRPAANDIAHFGRTLLGIPHGANAAGLALRNMLGGLRSNSTGIAGAAFEAATRLDSMTRGLATVSSNAEDLTAQLSRLREIAKLPGLSFEEAVSGSLRLQSASLSVGLAERALRSFGNAAASAGGRSEDLGEAIRQLGQIAGKGKLGEDDIKQIAARIPQLKKAIFNAFGTVDNKAINALGLPIQQVIEKIVVELEKLPKVSGGIATLLENISDRYQKALVPLGRGIAEGLEASQPAIFKFLDGMENRFTQIGEVLAAVGKSGVLGDVLKMLSDAGGNLFPPEFREGFAHFAADVLSTIANLPKTIKDITTYLGELFSALFNNILAIVERPAKVFDYLVQNVAIFVSNLGKAASLLYQFDFGGAAKVFSDNPPSNFPAFSRNIVGLPDLPNINPLGANKDDFFKRIKASLGPLGLPGGLVFGGNTPFGDSATGDSEGSVVDQLLRAIEENTKKAADALSLRAQSLGGGELARLGVTATELGRSSSGFSAPLVPGNSQLEQATRKLIREEIAKSGGSRVRVGG